MNNEQQGDEWKQNNWHDMKRKRTETINKSKDHDNSNCPRKQDQQRNARQRRV